MKKKKGFLRMITGILFVLVLGVLSSCTGGNKIENTEIENDNQDGKTIVTIGYLPLTHALAVFEEKELLEEQNAEVQIKLQKFNSWTDLTDALNSGKIDGASVLIELAMNAVGQGIDLKAVALGHKDGNVVVVSNDISSVEELEGKTFAIPSNQSSHYILLNDMLSSVGLTIEDLNVTQLAPAEMPFSLASGSIDGYCVAEPYGALVIARGFGHILYKSEDLWENSQCCAFVLNNNFIQKNPEAADTIVNTYFQAGKALNFEKAMEISTKYLGQEDATLEESLQWISYDDLALTEEDYTILKEKVIAYGINDNPPAYEDFVYSK